MLRSVFNFLINKSWWALTLLLIAIGLLLSQIQYFELDASSESLALEGDDNLYLFEKTQETFQTSDSLIISYTTENDVLDSQQIKHFRALRDDILALEDVASVTSILDVPLFQSPPLSLLELIEDEVSIDNGKADISLIADEFNNSPLYADNLISSDGKTTALLINLEHSYKPNKNALAHAVQNIRTTIKGYSDHAQIYLGGVPIIKNNIIAYIANDLVLFSFAVVLVMSIMLAFIFKGIRWVLLPIGISITGALIMTGTLGAMGWKVTVISANFFSLLLVMTLSVTIHLVVRFKELAKKAPEVDVKELTLLTLQQMSKPCLFTTLTTIAAFTSLMISDIRPVIDFGRMMAIGVTIALALSFLTFPILMSLLPTPKIKNHTTELAFTQTLAHFTHKRGTRLIIALIVIIVIALIGVSRLSVENRFIDYFKESSEIYQGLSLIDQKLGGTMSLEIVIDDTANAFWVDDFLRQDIHDIHQYLNSLDATGKVLSIDTLLQIITQANDDIPPSGFLLMTAKNQMSEFTKAQLLVPYLSETKNQLRIVARIHETDGSLNRDEFIHKVRMHLIDEFNLEPEKFQITGVFALYNNLLQSLFESQIKTIALVFAMIFVMFLFIFRSISLSILALIPNTLPSLLILGLMGLANIPLDLMTITIAAITIGMGVDNAIHYIHRFQTEFKVDQDYLKTMYRSHASIGLAMFYTSITVAIGFLVLALSNFIPSIYFGIFTAIAMLSAALANLTLLPKLILIFKPKMTK